MNAACANLRTAASVNKLATIAAVVGLKDTLTGHTLTDRDHPVHLEEISVPDPVIDLAIRFGRGVTAIARRTTSTLRAT